MRGDGRVFRRGQIWWVAYYHDGREHRESSKSRERKAAVRLLRTPRRRNCRGDDAAFPHVRPGWNTSHHDAGLV